MTTYRVRWAAEYLKGIEHPVVSLEADSPEEAYSKFLDSKTTVRNIDVIVEWGIFGFERFSEHIEEAERKAKGEERKQQKGERMSEREKQEQLLRMMEDEQKGTPKLTPTTHTPKAEDVRETGSGVSAKQPDPVHVSFDLVERRSGWAVLQFLCGVICIIAGCVFLGDNEEITGIAFIAIGVQAFFIGFLINVFTDIRWFLQESLKIQRERKR